MPKTMDFSNFGSSAACSPPRSVWAAWYTTARPTGIIIIVAAVLETHIDRKAVATMKPSTMRFGLVPIAETIERAMRWWRFHFSIAIARVKPPMNKKMMSLP